MLTLREQLRHKPFRLWTQKKPNLKAVGTKPPWRVYVQREELGNWAFKDFNTWAEAYRFSVKYLKRWHDIALHCKRQPFQPPIVRVAGVRRVYSPSPAPWDHQWCGYCRRMVQFKFFINGRHPVIGKCDPGEARCVICGFRLMHTKTYRLLDREA